MLRPLSMVIALILVLSPGTLSLTWAADTECDGQVTGPGIVQSVVVPAGTLCVVADVVINGNITVKKGATLRLIGGVTTTGNLVATFPERVQVGVFEGRPRNVILGNVKITGAEDVEICGAHIGGNVVIADMQDDEIFGGNNLRFGGNTLAICSDRGGGNTVAGDVRVHRNYVGDLFVADNVVRGQVLVNANTGPEITTRPITIRNNVIGGKLSCKANTAKVQNISGNDAKKTVGQCAQ